MGKKLYYKIGEACRELDIQPYVLRYWETEFPVLKPTKSRSGQRVYTEQEIAVIRRIKQLLYDEGYTIAGAKKRLEAESQHEGEKVAAPVSESGAVPAGESAGDLDSASREEIEHLRRGIRDALEEAKEILILLKASN